jgi:hypothetical protein
MALHPWVARQRAWTALLDSAIGLWYTVAKVVRRCTNTKEGRKMKTHSLRGLLLGVSLALLLVGGAALAQGLSITVDQDCFECWARADGWPPPDDHIVHLTLDGYDPNEYHCGRLTMAGVLWEWGCWYPVLPGPPCTVELAVLCETQEVMMASDCSANGPAAAGANFGNGAPAEYGEWVWRMWQTGTMDPNDVTAGPVFANFEYAEVCEEEFVPEAGTILLLGSGLAGLAGYATLRWRTRE